MLRRYRWPLLIALVGLALVLSILLAQSPVQSPDSPQPVSGGVYHEAVIGTISRLNPILDDYNQVDRDVDQILYRGLIQFDTHGFPQPDLAESWAVSADATLYSFKLREDAVWHDGEPVVADDITFTFSKFQDEDYPGPADLQDLWSEVKIVKLDDLSVQFQLSEPFAPFIDYLAVGLLPEHLLRGVSAGELVDHPFNLQPIGTGPFKFDRFLVDGDEIKGIRLVAFDDFYADRPFLDEIEIHLVPDEPAAWDSYSLEEVQGISNVDKTILADVLSDSNLNLHSARLPQFGIVFLNLKHPEKTFFADKSVRQALMLAINRQFIIDQVFDSQAIIPNGPILPGTWAHADALNPLPYDPQAAMDLLDDQGWVLPSGASTTDPDVVRSLEDQTLDFRLAYPDDAVHARIAQTLQEYWQAIGVRVELAPEKAEDLLETYLEPREFEAVLTELDLGPYLDPDPYPFWHDSQSETGQNYSGFSDRNIGIWLEKARTTPDFITRTGLYENFQYRFQDQIPALLLYVPVYNFAIHSQILGVSIGPLSDASQRFTNVNDWYIQARRREISQ